MDFHIVQLPRDLEGAKSHVARYKAFRLLSLKKSPESFRSTYEREVAFAHEIWLGRLTNPAAVTFVAIQEDRFVGSLTLVGPLPISPLETSSVVDPTERSDNPFPSISHWRYDGMYTLPEARGKGIATALIQKAHEFGLARAAASTKDYVGSLLTDADNAVAISVYKKCGFVTMKEEPMEGRGEIIDAVLMVYAPNPSSPFYDGKKQHP